ncbi:MAG: metal ABC transporter permease [Tissierellia bacterium]|nr:metal ABC transporter permease [Tissierellia bacterium]
MIQVLYVLITVSMVCGLPGVFLYYRRQSMVTDAISHSVLLGIVLAFFITKDIDSPLLYFGAAIFGVLTVFCIEMLTSSGLVKSEDATGIVFPLFFALAVILITKFAGNVHLDTDIVLMGEVIMTPMNTVHHFGLEMPRKLVELMIMFLANLLFILLFYKELKLMTFNEEYARLQGLQVTALSYVLMTLTSCSAVVAFDAVGAILVISFMITPAAAASLITKDLKNTLVVTMIYGIINSIIGYYLGVYLNINISGMCAVAGLATLFLTFLLYPEGPLMSIFLRKKRKQNFLEDLLLLHIGRHTGEENEERELGVNNLATHLKCTEKNFTKTINLLKKKDEIQVNEKNLYTLTEKGVHRYKELAKRFG